MSSEPEGGEVFALTDLYKPLSMEVSLNDVDPDLLNLLTGGAIGSDPAPIVSLEATYFEPVPRRAWRVVWDWICRRPRQYTEHHIVIPRANLIVGEHS